MYRQVSAILWKGLVDRLRTPLRTQKLSTSIRGESPSSNPTLLAKLKCHPTIPCGIPRIKKDLNALWFRISDELLPTNWSSNWLKFRNADWFLPDFYDTYSMGSLDAMFKANYRIPYPIKGVMYCTVDWPEDGGLFEQQQCGNHECIVFQDALGDYYFYYEFSQGGDEYLARFRAPRGTTVTDFVKYHFQGAVKGVDMDLVLPEDEYGTPDYYMLQKEQKEQAELWQAQSQSCCACRRVPGALDARVRNLRLVE